ncbi:MULTISPECIES: hypothetical protein [unclassified Streptomyces]|uniref:hypothetical protein n=1 Tax=unclassified Streptomyces TaxID=2593676 RepID=UPI0007C6469C|nr:hypothetical protein [Streptomyces sp. PCS3-D2]WKV74825.1 hypothetical protein AW27_026905 [Streptomyces sp. PCS3-D2]
MRPARDRDSSPAVSHTPIYDTLYSEYLRAFRALPGDRTGEEDLGFTAFSYGGGHTGGTYGSGWSASPWQRSEWQPFHGSQAPSQPQTQPAYSYAGGLGYADGRQHQTGMTHLPAALPPAPRRGY